MHFSSSLSAGDDLSEIDWIGDIKDFAQPSA